jgi:hypothetical protein
MKEYQKLAKEFIDYQYNDLDTFTVEEMITAYESAFLKAREMALKLDEPPHGTWFEIPIEELEQLGEREV